MKIALLIRGHHYLDTDRFGYHLDARSNIQSLMRSVVEPVMCKYPESRVYLATYESPVISEIKSGFDPCDLLLLNSEGSSQVSTYRAAIERIYNDNFDFDAIVALRFDLDIKKCFDDWGMTIDRDKIYFPFREYLEHWRDHRRVGDAVHIIGRNAVPVFHRMLSVNDLSMRGNMHMLYYFLRTVYPHLHFIEDQYWDSNTLYANPECNNPLYVICNRPRLEEYAPYTGKILFEIRAE